MPSGGGVGVLGSSTCVCVRHGCISSLKTKVHQKVLIKVIEMMGAMGGDVKGVGPHKDKQALRSHEFTMLNGFLVF